MSRPHRFPFTLYRFHPQLLDDLRGYSREIFDPHKTAAFERLCALQDRTPSQVVRQFIRDYFGQRRVSTLAGGLVTAAAASHGDAAPAPTKHHSRHPHTLHAGKPAERMRA